MKISIGSQFDNIDDLSPLNGFGYATDRMLNSLSILGYEWGVNLKDSDVEIWFEQPHNVRWKNESTYKICYVPWESTALPGLDYCDRSWLDVMNSADEVWTPSPLIAKWYKEYMGIIPPVFVYEHGVDSIWKPVHRKVDDKFRFLHVGMEALRKGGGITIDAFRKAFPDPKKSEVELTMKTTPNGNKIGWLRGINFMNEMTTIEELVELFHSHHSYVYPSWGEGFGLTPLQAMATGMPTITVPAWAPYAHFLHPYLTVNSRLSKSPWPRIHPGMMFKPDVDDVVDKMRYVYENYDAAASWSYNKVDRLVEHYDWNRLTKTTFEDLEKRLKLVAR